MRKPPPEVFGLHFKVIAEACGVSPKTAMRWKTGQSVPPKTALMIIERDLGCFSPAWRGWRIRGEELVSPEGWIITRNDVLATPLMRSQLAIYQAENRALREILDHEEFDEDQPLPSQVTFEVK